MNRQRCVVSRFILVGHFIWTDCELNGLTFLFLFWSDRAVAFVL